MSLVDFLFLYILTCISLFTLFKSYQLIASNEKLNFNTRNIFIILISSLLFVLNSIFNIYVNKALISAVILIVSLKIIFHNEWNKTIFLGLICFLAELLIEFLFSIIVVLIIPNYVTYSSNGIFVGLFTIIVSILTLLFFKIKYINIWFNKILDILGYKYLYVLLIIIGIVFMGFLIQKYSIEYSLKTYLHNLILFLIFIIIMCIALVNSIRVEKEVKSKNILIEFLEKYEKIIDNDRINRHEMLNNLLILKSYKNKNTNKYNQILDDFICLYDTNKNDYIKNISKIPSGFKGILYYKINEMKSNGINLFVHISRNIKYSLDNVNYKDYVAISKILGILLDNAYEASVRSAKKEILIDIYEEDSKLFFVIENSYNGKKIDINECYKKNYSTKGKGRGLGLHVAKMLIKESRNIELYQNTDGKTFSSKLILK